MEYRQLGRTDLTVSAVSFGAWAIGGWGKLDDERSMAPFTPTMDAGVNFIDQPTVRIRGEERLVGEPAPRGKGERIFVGTKGAAIGPSKRRRATTRENQAWWSALRPRDGGWTCCSSTVRSQGVHRAEVSTLENVRARQVRHTAGAWRPWPGPARHPDPNVRPSDNLQHVPHSHGAALRGRAERRGGSARSAGHGLSPASQGRLRVRGRRSPEFNREVTLRKGETFSACPPVGLSGRELRRILPPGETLSRSHALDPMFPRSRCLPGAKTPGRASAPRPRRHCRPCPLHDRGVKDIYDRRIRPMCTRA